MNRRIWVVAGLAALALAGACDSITGNGSNKLLQFTANRAGPVPRDYDPQISALGSNSALVVHGEMILKCSNYSVNRSAEQDGSTIRMKLSWKVPSGGTCTDSTTLLVYDALLGSFDAGTYTFEAVQPIYQGSDSWSSGAVGQQTITIQ